MAQNATPIRRRLMTIILVTSTAALLFTCAAFFAYEYFSFRQSALRNIQTLGRIIASNSTAALAFSSPDDAREILAALRSEEHIVAAGLYDADGALFATFPETLSAQAFPSAPGDSGYQFTQGHLEGFEPVVQGLDWTVGTLYLRSDTGAIYARFRLYGLIAALVFAASVFMAFLISRGLQRQISQPLLALADTARAVSDRQDYSVRAPAAQGLELRALTDALNHMLTQIQRHDSSQRESEARVRAVLNSALSAVVVIDAGGKIIDWNARAEAVFGWGRSEVLGKELAATIIPERYREAHRRGLQHYLTTGEGPVLNRLLELSAVRRDAHEFPVELQISPLGVGDSITFCGFVTDITERREAQRKVQAQLSRLELLSRITRAITERQDPASIFKVVIHHLEDDLSIDFGCVCLHEPPAEFVTVASVGTRSQLLAPALGITEKTRIAIGQNGLARCLRGNLVHEPDLSNARSPFGVQLARAGCASLVIAPLRAESVVFGLLLAARREPNAFSSGDCEFLRQLSEHVALASHQTQLHAALQAAYDDLRQSQQTILQQERLRALGQMASGIAHDINNALSPVSLYTESLLEREPGLSERAREYLRTIQRGVDDVAQTVARMREFYRPREPQLVLTPVDLNDLARQVIDLTRARWRDVPQERGIVVELDTALAEHLPGIVGAENEIRDALTNLIFNAVDAMPRGGTLTLRTDFVSSARPDEETARHAVIEVRDTGVGMDEETRRRCLEPFYTTKGERGTGLGLAMVFGMVQRHSAELEIDSAPGAGTAVRLIFPVPVVTAAAVRLPTSPLEMRRLRVLIVDDDPLLIKSLRDILEADGHVVTTAEGGQAAIDAFLAAESRGEPFGAVVTDLGMPYVDGRKVAATVRAASPSVLVILLTGWGQRLLEEDDLPEGVDRVLSKPPKLHELRAAFAMLQERSALAR